MTKIKQFTKKIFISILIIISFFMAQNTLLFSQMNFNNTQQEITSGLNLSTSSSNIEDKTSSISNNKFETTTSGSSSTDSSYYTGNTAIKTPSSWNKDGKINSDLFIGSINVADSSFNEHYEEYNLKIDDKPISNEIYETVLMINSNNSIVYGYKSSEFTLDANSFYAISVELNTTASASVCLYGTDVTNNPNAIISNVQTTISTTNEQIKGSWGKATIWISTSATAKSTVQLGLYLGTPTWAEAPQSQTSGFVLFDNVKLVKYSQSYFAAQNKTTDYASKTFNTHIDLRSQNIESGDGFVQDGDFANSTNLENSSYWTVENTGTNSQARVKDANIEITNNSTSNLKNVIPYTNERASDNNILLILNTANKNGSSSSVITSAPITIKQHSLYRISFWAKTNASSISASLSTIDETVSGTSYTDAVITTASSSTNVTTNDWNEYVFIVVGNPLIDTQIQLSLGLSSSNNEQDEYVAYDNITSQKISSSEKDNISSLGITNATFNLTPTNSATISNGYFNETTSINNETTYPLTPASWTYNGISSALNKSGIINLKSTLFNAQKGNFGNPIVIPESSFVSNQDVSNNVLMFYNTIQSQQSYSSDSSLSASTNTNYKLSVNIFTNILSTNGGINIELVNSEGITMAQVLDINTNEQWQTYNLYFGNYGCESQTLTLKISFGRDNKLASGWAYIDNCMWESYSDSLDDITTGSFNNTSAISTIQTAYNYVINLNKKVNNESALYVDTFGQYNTDSISSDNDLNTPLYWTGQSKVENDTADVRMGVVNSNNIDNVLSPYRRISSNSNNDSLMIYSETETYYEATNKLCLPLSESSYYKLTLKVKTINISENGASIILDGIEKSFTKINTNGTFEATEDGWLDYTFYINTTEAIELSIKLGLGSGESALSNGYVFFDDITLIKMEEEDFNIDLNLDNEDTTKTDRIISIVNTSTTDEDNTQTNSNVYTESLKWLSIPTLLIAIGTIIAVIAYCIKRYMNNRPIRVNVESNYDRSSTLLKDLDHRNYKVSLKHKLDLLREELKQTEKYLQDEIDEHKRQSEAYETAKDIAEQDKSIQLEEPDQKYKDYGNTVKQLEKNIASLKADIILLEEEQKEVERQGQELRKNDLTGNTITRTGRK